MEEGRDRLFSKALPSSSYTAVVPADLSSSSVSAEQRADTERQMEKRRERERGRDRVAELQAG